MKLSEYDIQRIASEIVVRLTADERFARTMAKMLPKADRLLTSTQAANLCGTSRKYVCQNADKLGGFRGSGTSAHWMFRENGLVERFAALKLENEQ